ncbi:MAG: hypothetical protein PHI18_05535 [bacterium]|nr:hypothetical protein [bacterium]
MRTFIATILICAASALALAQSSGTLGERPGAFSARSLGLGHAFLTDQTGPAALLGNPATMAAQTERWTVDLSGDISRVKETRKYPVYDSFDGVLIYNNYAVNDHLYSKLDGGVCYRVPTTAVQSLVLSAASYSTYRFDYRYHEEVRDRYSSGGIQDRRLGDNRIDVDGDLRSISLGAATRTHGPLAVGFSVNVLTGSWDYTRGVYYANEDSTNHVDNIAYEPDGTLAELTLGATWELNPRVTFGARALMPAGDFKFKQDVQRDDYIEHVESGVVASGSVTTTYPNHYGAGVWYRPQSEFRPILMLEGELHTYADVSDAYDNTFEIRAGAEQEVVAGTPVRLGFVYADAPDDENRATTLFTAGIGFRLQKLAGDFAMEVGKINTTSPDLFPQSLYGAADRTDNDKVETALFRGMMTLRYAL